MASKHWIAYQRTPQNVGALENKDRAGQVVQACNPGRGRWRQADRSHKVVPGCSVSSRPSLTSQRKAAEEERK